jgi:putative FmdB family regulatory protein
MPLYEYRCRDCGHRFEVLQRLGDGADGLTCPMCGAGDPARQFSTFAAVGSSSAAPEAPVQAGGCACGLGGCGRPSFS